MLMPSVLWRSVYTSSATPTNTQRKPHTTRYDMCDSDSERPSKRQRSKESSSSSSDKRGPISLLYSDAIQCILQFVRFDELMCLTEVNTQWRESVRTLKPRQKTELTIHGNAWDRNWKSATAISTWQNSALLAHVDRLRFRHAEFQSLALYCSRLTLFPSLTFLACLISEEATNPSNPSNESNEPTSSSTSSATFQSQVCIQLPQTLTSLFLEVKSPSMQLVVNTISELPQLQRVRLLYFQEAKLSWAKIDFSPLLKLKGLEELSVNLEVCGIFNEWLAHPVAPAPTEPEDSSLIQTIRQMSTLRRLDIGEETDLEDLRALAKQPNQLQQLEYLHVATEMTQEYANTLVQFPGLTGFGEIYPRFSDFSFLLSLSNLRSIDFVLLPGWSPTEPPDPDHLTACMKTLPQLTSLTLHYRQLEDRHLDTILPRLTRLNKLALIMCTGLRALTWLRSVATQLTSVALEYCQSIPVAQHVELFVLSRLERLVINTSFNESLNNDVLQQFQPRSQRFPLLTKCDISTDSSYDEAET